jgi:hypothetical protein
LVNLNFLELSGGGELTSLPDTLGNLQNLTTLLLKANMASVFFSLLPGSVKTLQPVQPKNKASGEKIRLRIFH